MKSKLLLLSSLFLATPAFAQFAYLQDIDVNADNSSDVEIIVNGVKPSPCFVVDSYSEVEDQMVTINLEVKFPEGTTRCAKKNAPFKVSNILDTLDPGEYEVQVTINGEMQVQYRHFNVEDGDLITTASLRPEL